MEINKYEFEFNPAIGICEKTKGFWNNKAGGTIQYIGSVDQKRGVFEWYNLTPERDDFEI